MLIQYRHPKTGVVRWVGFDARSGEVILVSEDAVDLSGAARMSLDEFEALKWRAVQSDGDD